jgi:Ulp1 family protease
MSFKTVKTLAPNGWVSSFIVDSHASMLAERNYAMNQKRTIFYGHTRMMDQLYYNKNYEFNPFIFKKTETSLVDIQFFLFPIYEKSHYFLIAYDVETKTVKYYDSLFNEERGRFYTLFFKKYIQDLYKFKDIEVSEEEIHMSNDCDHPQQFNSCDCGVYTTVFMNLLTDGIPLAKFEKKHVGIWRNLMLSHLINNKMSY